MKKLLLTLILFVFISPNLKSQDCGTIPTQQQLDYLTQTRTARQNWNQAEVIIWLPIQHHVVRESNGTGGLTAGDISFVMNELNTYYLNSDVQFYECASVNYINNSAYYDFNANDENIFCGSNDIQDVINIYYFNSVTSSSGSSLCGYAYFPPGPDRVIMANSCAINGSTIVHELGHYLSLYHTHGPTNTGTTTELVNWSNCWYAGDDLCDTPADPNLSGLVVPFLGSCLYVGTAVDANFQAYVPDPTNIMSYSLNQCRSFMSTLQYSRSNYSAINDRNYLTCSASSWDCNNGVCTGNGTGTGTYISLSACQSACLVTPTWDCISPGNCQDPGTGLGAYSSLSACQSNCVAVTYDCINNACIDPGTGNGTYASLGACDSNSNCVAVTYDCINNTCTDPGTGNGTYASLSACQSACVVAASWNCLSPGNCQDPGTGNGQHSTLSACQSNCIIIPTWDCLSSGNCQDPGTGNGTYASLSACQGDCSVEVTYDCINNACIDPGTGNGQYSTLTACQIVCNVNGINDNQTIKRKLKKITDMLGQETPYRRNTPLFYIYDDGTVEKIIIIE